MSVSAKTEYTEMFHSNKEYCQYSRKDGSHPFFGLATLMPVVVSTLFTIVHWWKIEATLFKKVITFPLVFCQVWAQYRVARIIFLGFWVQSKKWRFENEFFKKNVGSLGMIFSNRTPCACT